MRRLKFKAFWEATDIFGFEPKKPKEEPFDHFMAKPIYGFDLELMMNYLSKKSVGANEANNDFISEMRWGSQPGSVKLEVDTGYTFFIKKLATDKQGNPRWITKKAFQLNRNGYGGMEDVVAQEIYEQISKYAEGGIDSPLEEYKDLDALVHHIYGKLKRNAKQIFLPEGVKKINDDVYVIKFGVRGQGVEARNHQRVEQNQTMISYDKEQGTIRVTNYNLQSGTGRGHEFKINQNDLDVYFLPSQDKEEISEVLAVHMKFY